MSHHYATKALGRAWIPSPTASPRMLSRGRYDTVRLRQTAATQDSWFQDLRFLRGRLIERLGVLLALAICAAYLVFRHDQFVKPAVHAWTQSLHRLRLGCSLIPSWSRVDWSSYSYVSYATSPDHVCNSLMLAESLHRLGARPDTLILYALELVSELDTNTSLARLLQQASQMYDAHVQPVDRDTWLWLYKEFRERRKRVCGPEFTQYEEAERFLENLPLMAKGLAKGWYTDKRP
jgi:hypothetical protein